MKRRVKFIISLLLIPLMFLSLITSSVLLIDTVADSPGYNKKIVAVVYDNSGSMSIDDRDDYAKYAMQGLMSVLDVKDTLVIFPLNTDFGQSVEVDLSAEDRNAEVESIIANNAFKSLGTTPPGAISTAVNWLASQGLNKDEVLEGKEFWLVILSDGEFDGSKSTSEIIRGNISGYVGLQTVYFGMCASDAMRIDDLVSENSAVSAYYTSSATQIISAMQDITNRTTGRYTMTTGITSNGTTVEIDLSTCGFSVVSVAVLAQGSGESVAISSVECASTEVKLLRPCSISSKGVGLSGYSAMISPNNDTGYLSGDKLTLNFNTQPQSVTILLEPAIALESNLQHNDGGVWKDVDEEYINTTLKKGANIRARYRLVDRLTGKDLTDILTNVNATLSYNGKISSYDQGFTLENGKKEIALSVTVNISGSSYTLYNSWICQVDENPTYFRIESKSTKGYGGNQEKVKIDYTIYYDNVKVKKSDLEGSSAKFSWQLLELTNPEGQTITQDSLQVNSDGTISLIYSTAKGEYGAYTAKLKVLYLENRRSRTSTETIKIYPSTLDIATGDKTEIALSIHQLKNNIDKFEFSLSSSGYPISFDSGVVEYKLTIGGTDVTSLATINGNVISFMPDTTTITGTLKNIGNKEVKLEVWSSDDSSIANNKTLSLDILAPTYVIEVLPQDTEIDIYDLKNSTAKIYYRASIDGDWLNEKELREALETKEIKVNSNPFGWIFLLPTQATTTVETINGDAVICVSIGTNWFSPLDSLVASLIFTGDKTVTISYGTAIGDGVFNLKSVPFISRLWRWIVIIIIVYTILHIILWILGFAIAKSLPKGVMVRMTLNQVMPTQAVSATTKGVNLTSKEKVKWHLKRFIPFKEFMNQKEVVLYGIKVLVTSDRERRLCLTRTMGEVIVLADDEDKTYLDFIEFKRKWRNYVNGNKKPKLASFSTKKLNYLLEDRDKEHKAGKVLGVNETCYVTRDEKGRIVNITFFIQTK